VEVSKLKNKRQVCPGTFSNLFRNLSKFVHGVSKLKFKSLTLVSTFPSFNNSIMGRSKSTSPQEYAAMVAWVEVPKNLDHLVGAATRNLRGVVAGAKVTKISAYGELAKYVNEVCCTTNWTAEHAKE